MGKGHSIFENPTEIRLARLRALLALFQKTDRILSGRPVTCVLSGRVDVGAPAFTDTGTATITFVDKSVGHVATAEDIVRLGGLNYHELGHAIYSPDFSNASRVRDSLTDFIRNELGAHTAYNILEDQRQESMLVATWPSVMHHLTATFVEFIMNRREVDKAGNEVPADHSTTWLLAHGRRYLGSEVREALKAMFVSPELVGDFETVIDRYRVLNLDRPADRDTAKILIQRWLELISRLPSGSQQQAGDYQHSNVSIGGGGSGKKSENIKQSAKANEGVKNGDDDRDNIGGGEGGNSADGDANDGDTDTDWRADETGDGKGGGKGKDSHKVTADRDHGSEELNKAIQDVLNDILKDNDVSETVRQQQQAMKTIQMGEPIRTRIGTRDLSNGEAPGLARRLARKLTMLVEQKDPGWDQRTATGRMNIGRVVGNNGRVNVDEMFDTWQEGEQDAASMESIIIVDTSGSMGGSEEALGAAVWTIKSTMDQLNAPCTAYSFSDGNDKLVYEAKDKALPGRMPKFYAGGGTNPQKVVQEGARRLMQSRRKKRFMILMTDGAFNGSMPSPHPDEYIASLNAAGVTTVLAFFDKHAAGRQKPLDPAMINSHNCQIVQVIGTLDDLVEMNAQIVRATINRR